MTVQALSLASFFTIEAREYVHFSFNAAARNTLRNVILAFCIGILLASLYMLYQKLVPGNIVRAILQAKAHTPDAAKTLTELGLDKNPLYRFELRRNAVLKKTVLRAVKQSTSEAKDESTSQSESEATGKTQEGAAEEERFYIPEEGKYRAEVRFDKKGNGVVGLVVTAVLTVVLAILLIKLTPAVLGMIDNLLG